ncbi:DNA recombination protein RmuC [Mycoplasma cottewii]|uniref:DNA recombination protein RmuC n=1 Tax=Mycoplasma cottewii TaxID=51364 RepID=A0ABY5TX82_9MOLU|nr:DNA recombination protein RmuC [Mycoplasma cottewii]UWD34810.1 DNA recombination protein RmuC [Mycoplasma cottewii]
MNSTQILLIVLIALLIIALSGIVVLLIKNKNQTYPVQDQSQLTNKIQQIITDLTAKTAADKEKFENLTKTVGEQKTDLTNSVNQQKNELKDSVDKQKQELTESINQQKSELKKSIELLNEQFKILNNTAIESKTKLEQVNKDINASSDKIADISAIFKNSKTRGNIGEYTLEWILTNILGDESVDGIWQREYQYKNGSEKPRIDAIIRTGINDKKIAIDSKFPLQKTDILLSSEKETYEYKQAQKEFKDSINQKIKDLSSKYINKQEGVDSVIMYIPSEVIFELIINDFRDVYKSALDKRIWITSPTTLPVMLHAQQIAIKDYKISKNIDEIQKTMNLILKDLERWDKRNTILKKAYDKYVKDTNEAFEDLETSKNKIISNIENINKVKITTENDLSTEDIKADYKSLFFYLLIVISDFLYRLLVFY